MVSQKIQPSSCRYEGDRVIRDLPSSEWKNVPVDGRRLRTIRAEQGLSQENLASKAKVGLTTIRNLETRPEPACRAWTMGLIAAALGTQPALLTRSDNAS
jgi:DNA-binding XRE family transcriptional regulator